MKRQKFGITSEFIDSLIKHQRGETSFLTQLTETDKKQQ
jgi:hypothetical protein